MQRNPGIAKEPLLLVLGRKLQREKKYAEAYSQYLAFYRANLKLANETKNPELEDKIIKTKFLMLACQIKAHLLPFNEKVSLELLAFSELIPWEAIAERSLLQTLVNESLDDKFIADSNYFYANRIYNNLGSQKTLNESDITLINQALEALQIAQEKYKHAMNEKTDLASVKALMQDFYHLKTQDHRASCESIRLTPRPSVGEKRKHQSNAFPQSSLPLKKRQVIVPTALPSFAISSKKTSPLATHSLHAAPITMNALFADALSQIADNSFGLPSQTIKFKAAIFDLLDAAVLLNPAKQTSHRSQQDYLKTIMDYEDSPDFHEDFSELDLTGQPLRLLENREKFKTQTIPVFFNETLTHFVKILKETHPTHYKEHTDTLLRALRECDPSEKVALLLEDILREISQAMEERPSYRSY